MRAFFPSVGCSRYVQTSSVRSDVRAGHDRHGRPAAGGDPDGRAVVVEAAEERQRLGARAACGAGAGGSTRDERRRGRQRGRRRRRRRRVGGTRSRCGGNEGDDAHEPPARRPHAPDLPRRLRFLPTSLSPGVCSQDGFQRSVNVLRRTHGPGGFAGVMSRATLQSAVGGPFSDRRVRGLRRPPRHDAARPEVLEAMLPWLASARGESLLDPRPGPGRAGTAVEPAREKVAAVLGAASGGRLHLGRDRVGHPRRPRRRPRAHARRIRRGRASPSPPPSTRPSARRRAPSAGRLRARRGCRSTRSGVPRPEPSPALDERTALVSADPREQRDGGVTTACRRRGAGPERPGAARPHGRRPGGRQDPGGRPGARRRPPLVHRPQVRRPERGRRPLGPKGRPGAAPRRGRRAGTGPARRDGERGGHRRASARRSGSRRAPASEAARPARLREPVRGRAPRARPGARVNAAGGPRLPTASSVTFPGADGETLVAALDLEGIAASAGAACPRDDRPRAGSSSPSAFRRPKRGRRFASPSGGPRARRTSSGFSRRFRARRAGPGAVRA